MSAEARSSAAREQIRIIADEDQLRAQLYQLVALPLGAPPSKDVLNLFAGLKPDDTAIGAAIGACAAAAAATGPGAEDEAYHDLFIGIGAGELVPFGSYYLTGFLHEKPLAKLRGEMDRLGIEQDPGVKEPEDHISSVMEIMAGLIEGRFGEPASISEQHAFFDEFVGSWAPHFFNDLAATRRSRFYAAVGSLGAIFIDVEAQAYEYS